MDTEDDGEQYFQAFKKQITEIDDVANVVLKGHLLIERQIDRIISQAFFHPEYILNGRQNFERKAQIVRAMSLNAHDHPTWNSIMAVNSLRNEIAHKHPGEKRKKKTNRIRQVCLNSMVPKTRERYKNETDTEIVIFACAMCYAFLGFVEEDMGNLREEINCIIAKHHAEE